MNSNPQLSISAYFSWLTRFHFLWSVLFFSAGIAHAGDHAAAAAYALKWATGYNSSYHNYSQGGGREDVNFVSQAFRAGQKFSKNDFLDLYLDDRGNFRSVFEFENQLDLWEHAEGGWTDSLPPLLAEGDVVRFTEAVGGDDLMGIIVRVRDDGGYDVAYHIPQNDGSSPAGGIKTMAELILVYGGVIYSHIERKTETTQKAKFYGTGKYEGPGGLSIQILRPGENYLGYIVRNQNPAEQDMVIGTNTSDVNEYPGCSYLISGYCADPAKDAPSIAQGFGEPFTSESKNHWAYWVRQAVIWADEHGTDPQATQEAVWYIVASSQRADYIRNDNPILKGINFPSSGPVKGTAELDNGSFEVFLAPWLGVNTTIKDTIDCAQAMEGNCSFKIGGQKRKKKYLLQTLAYSGDSGDTYELRVDSIAKRAKRKGKYFAELQILNTDDTIQQCLVKFSTAKKKNKSWQSKSLSCTALKTYEQVSVVLHYEKQKGTAWFDNISLIPPV